ncbi:phosphatase PAP2 family protein [Chlorobium sp. N1]|uniref:phosphatase PAP2 family protein n=1 Tax=Chlorobium sp. N1 TaxID=2491138 RepID=UPI00103B3B6B|nr:phosphatase PAP2 family protein [Chlorobium sp. N1]TCD47637.1 phosphatase PAP2 family protein [Chlorobium sp. N1]
MNTRARHLAATAAIILCCALSAAFLDRPLALYLHALDAPTWHAAFGWITRWGQSEWYLVPGIVLYFALRKTNRQLSSKGLFIFSVTAVSGLAADLVKWILGRARPTKLFNEGVYGLDWFRIEHAWVSFPSGHSATAFSVAAALALLYPRAAPVFYAAAALIAFSRMFLGQHFLSDVVAGSALGVATSLILYNRYFKESTHAPRQVQP